MGRNTAVVAAIVGVAFATPAMASELMDITVQGTIQDLADPGGLMAGVSPTDPFTLTYQVDFSKGLYGGGVGGMGGETFILGGSSQIGNVGPPSLVISPVSAELSVGGATFDFAGSYFGQVIYTYNDSDVMSGGTGYSNAEFKADGAPGSSSIDVGVGSNMWQTFALVDVNQPASFTIDGANITSSATFDYFSGGSEASGALDVTSVDAVVVSAAPEPADWALMLLGLGGVGGIMRMARRKTGAASAAN